MNTNRVQLVSTAAFGTKWGWTHMKSTLESIAAGCLALTVFASAACAAAAEPTPAERGKYIALAADCGSCHSAPGGRPFAGGAPLKTPFGKIYPPNITPDPKAGIGSWTEADFTRALREGVRKDGARLYPAMPYGSYTKMTDDDVGALWAYLRTVPAVKRVPPANTLVFPFNLRPGLAVWQAAYFKPGRFAPSPDKDAIWNRGAYLVDAMGHCGSCHTPRNIAQGLEKQRRLTGAQIEGWYAPDISSDPLSNLGTTSVDDLATFLKTGKSRGNVKSFGLMQEVVHDSLSHLGDDDIHAIAVYLKDQPGDARPQDSAQSEVPASELAAGKSLYEENCSGCHQSDGKGVAGKVPALAGNSAVTAREPYNVVMAMLEGFDPQGPWAAMASFASVLGDEQIAAVANYVRSAWGNKAQHAANEWSVGSLRAVAQSGASAPRAALVCPILPRAAVQPALSLGLDELKQSATDHDKLERLVGTYVAARPRASTAEVIEAMSSAYCRAIASPTSATARVDASMADFSQQVADVLVQRAAASSAAPATSGKSGGKSGAKSAPATGT